MPDIQLYDAFGYFYFTKLQRLELSGNPRTALAQAIGDSHLVIEQLAGSSAGPLAFVDKRFMIRNNIRQNLNAWLAQEQMQKRIRQQVYAESTPVEKMLIPVGAFFQGVINFGDTVVENVWGLGCWLKDVHDVANPFMAQYREFQAFGMAREKLGESASFSSVLAEQQKQAQILHKKELIEALGFDPSQLTVEQFTEALDIACIVCTDPILWGIFADFAIDYLKAQHFTELTEVGIAGVLELILLAAIIWVTLGVGVTAAVASQTRHLPKLKKIGQLLGEFADATRAFNRQVKERAAKIDGDSSAPKFTELDTVEGGAKKTDPHGAETGEISKRDSQKTPELRTLPPPAQTIGEAQERLAIAKNKVDSARTNGTPLPANPFTVADKKQIVANGLNENIVVRVIETKYSGDKGTVGQVKNGKSVTWTAPMSQVEHADSDAELLLNAFGTRHDSNKSYTMLIMDREKMAEIGDVESVIPTYDNINGMIEKYPEMGINPDTAKQVMNDDFAPKYEKFANSAWDNDVDMSDPEALIDFAKDDMGFSDKDALLLSERHDIANKISAWEIFTGNGMTRDTNIKDSLAYGPVEVFTFDKSPQTLGKLEAAGAIQKVNL